MSKFLIKKLLFSLLFKLNSSAFCVVDTLKSQQIFLLKFLGLDAAFSHRLVDVCWLINLISNSYLGSFERRSTSFAVVMMEIFWY